MPYIKEQDRPQLDNYARDISLHLKCNIEPTCIETDLTDEEFMVTLGRINYLFTSILMTTCGTINYNKIAMITGVLENVKQEFYRRAASQYEDKKILTNGDIKVYKKNV